MSDLLWDVALSSDSEKLPILDDFWEKEVFWLFEVDINIDWFEGIWDDDSETELTFWELEYDEILFDSVISDEYWGDEISKELYSIDDLIVEMDNSSDFMLPKLYEQRLYVKEEHAIDDWIVDVDFFGFSRLKLREIEEEASWSSELLPILVEYIWDSTEEILINKEEDNFDESEVIFEVLESDTCGDRLSDEYISFCENSELRFKLKEDSKDFVEE